MMDIDDGLDTLYEHDAMTDAELMEFIERNECLYAFNEAKNNLLKAQSDMVQAKYESLYQNSLLDFYRGKSLDF